MKKYSPATVKNPVIDGHIVRLHPGQELVVVCTGGGYEGVQVHERADFLKLERAEALREGSAYFFRQQSDLLRWVANANVLLGEIGVRSNFLSSSLCVLLDSGGPPGVVTAINPTGQSLKLETQHLLEVVICATSQGWSPLVSPGEFAVQQVVRGGGTNVGGLDDGWFLYRFWFRYGLEATAKARLLPRGVYPSGRIDFFGAGGAHHQLRLMLSVKRRQTTKPAERPIHNRVPGRSCGPFVAGVTLREIKDCTLDSGCRVVYQNCS